MKERYGLLTVIKEVDRRNGRRYFLCQCDCGQEKAVMFGNLKRGNVKSCGCLRHQAPKNQKHGLSKDASGKKTRLFRIWTGMKTRCFNQRDRAYPKYGGRGITICDEWLDYASFHAWAMSNGYADNLTIERIDNDGSYEPSNCKWIPRGEQASNRTTSILITYDDQTYTLAQWARKLGIGIATLHGRLKRGWTVERAFTTPVKS